MKQTKLFTPTLLVLAAASIWLAACASKRTVEYTIADVDLIAEGPLFEGANTAQATHSFDPDKLKDLLGAYPGQIVAVRLVAAELSLPDTLNFDIANEITLQLAADNAPMQKVAVLNPVPKGARSVALQAAAAQKGVDRLFKQSAMYLVADINLNADHDNDLALRGNFKFEIVVKN
ncbi:MAG: hypothetical protein ACK4NS_13435 [Saprospiraceae bacterium]